MNLREELLDAASCAGPELADLLRRAADALDGEQEPFAFYDPLHDHYFSGIGVSSDEFVALYTRPAPIPDNMHLVPVDPTREMRAAGNRALDVIKSSETPSALDHAFYVFSAMLKAARGES